MDSVTFIVMVIIHANSLILPALKKGLVCSILKEMVESLVEQVGAYATTLYCFIFGPAPA